MPTANLSEHMLPNKLLKVDRAFLIECFQNTRTNPLNMNRWMSAECWIQAMKLENKSPILHNLTPTELNNAISRSRLFKDASIHSTASANSTGLYKRSFSHHTSQGGRRKRRNVIVYCSTEPNELPQTTTCKWLINLKETSGNIKPTSTKRDLPLHPETPTGPKNKKLKETTIFFNSASSAGNPNITETWWSSPEASSLFGKTKAEQGEAKKHAQERAQRLIAAYASGEGWRMIVKDNDSNDLCTPHDIFKLQMQAKYISLSLRIALKSMSTKKNGVNVFKKQ